LHVGHGQRGGLGQARTLSCRLASCCSTAIGGSPTIAAAALQCGTQFDLAALEAVREQLAQRLVRAQLVGQAQGEVQKAAVDGAQVEHDAREGGLRVDGFLG
jgi:hypothetical protein